MPTGMRQLLNFSIHGLASRTMHSMGGACARKVGLAWQNAKVLKPQSITTVVLVDPKDVAGAPKNSDEKIPMQVTKRVKRGVHIDSSVSIVMPLQTAIHERL